MSLSTEADASRPALLLVHGAWFGAWCWDEVRLDLITRGWRVHTVDLPSVADRGSPRLGLFDDARMVRQRIIEIGGPVVVVAHSYGGAVASQAAAELPSVRHLVYICAFQMDVGECLKSLIDQLPDWWKIEGDIVTPRDARELFFHDVPRETAERAVGRLKPSSARVGAEPLTAAAWREIPSTYIVTDRDRAAPPAGQASIAARATYVRHLPSGHLPLLSMPSALADMIVEAGTRAAVRNEI